MQVKPKVLVIGSNSFSGADFIDHLIEQGYDRILGVSRSAEKSGLYLPYLGRSNHQDCYRYRQIDLNTQMPELFELLKHEKPAWIVNFAAQSEVAPSWEHPEHWFRTNGVAIAELGNFLRMQDWLERYLHVSSPEVYGNCEGVVTEAAPLNPTTPYAASKAAGDLMLSTLAKNFDFPLLSVRATNVYGPHQQLFKIIPRTAIFLKLGRQIELHGGGHAVKSYIHIRDVSQGELAILEAGRPGEIYHLSPAKGMAVREIVGEICKLRGQDFEAMTVEVSERLGQDRTYVISSAKARAELDWQDRIGLSQGLAQVCDWVDQYWDSIRNESLSYNHKA